GLQHDVLVPAEPWGLSLRFAILPERLSDLGYTNHMIGKWHLGYYKESYTPSQRGFDSFFGFYNGGVDYYTHRLFS
ncbi:unnamed protein product, partial [Ixodes hexagonus]